MKIHSAGSDYIVVNQAGLTAIDLPAMARRFCPPRAGVGADGLVVFTHRGRSRFVIRYFDLDGAESTADDKALRSCVCMINRQYGYRSATLIVDGGVHESRTIGDHIGIRFPSSREIIGPFAVRRRRTYGIWTGSDNIVTFTGDIDSIDPKVEENIIRKRFPTAMSRASINFAKILGGSSLRVRTFDWRTAAEATSSGAGALATAVVARRIGLCRKDRIEIQVPSGCSLIVKADGDSGEDSWLLGPAVFSFGGELPCQ